MTDVLVYTISAAPEFENFRTDLHLINNRGFGYETRTHFVHIFGGTNSRLGHVAHHWTVAEEKRGNLKNWIVRNFGAENIDKCLLPAGEVIAGVWRPGLRDTKHSKAALVFSEDEEWESEHALRLLIGRLDEIVNFIEPHEATLNVFGHKLRELLILACTEVENRFIQYLELAGIQKPPKGFTTQNYIKLKTKLYLADYAVKFKPYARLGQFRPFEKWTSPNTTVSLEWYDDYNQTKHDRKNHFDKSTLQNCLFAVSANIILHCARFMPYKLFDENSHLSSLINQYCEVCLVDQNPNAFYVGYLDLSTTFFQGLTLFDGNRFLAKWSSQPLRL
jgi:hypothetical protein